MTNLNLHNVNKLITCTSIICSKFDFETSSRVNEVKKQEPGKSMETVLNYWSLLQNVI